MEMRPKKTGGLIPDCFLLYRAHWNVWCNRLWMEYMVRIFSTTSPLTIPDTIINASFYKFLFYKQHLRSQKMQSKILTTYPRKKHFTHGNKTTETEHSPTH
jgi:hypothetical protein